MRFADYTISSQGNRFSRRRHYSHDLLPQAVQIFAELLSTYGREFRRPIPVPGFEHIELQWRSGQGAALATFLAGGTVLTTSALASGKTPEADTLVLRSVQGVLADLLRQFAPGSVPGLDAMVVPERPVIVSVPWPVELVGRLRQDLMLVADMETCLAAAFFESLRN